MNYKELSYAFKKIMSWYKKKTKVLNIKSRPYNTGFVFFDLISRLINDNKKVLYVSSDKFVNDFINAVRYNDKDNFDKKD